MVSKATYGFFSKERLIISKVLTPIKTIRAKCLDCSSGQMKEVRECSFNGIKEELCPFHPLRMGRGSRATLKRIRAYCIWCCNGQRNEVKLCLAVDCPLRKHRFGRRLSNTPSLPEILTTEGVLEANETQDIVEVGS